VPFVETDRIRIHYELEGAPTAPVLAFSNSLGTNLRMWEEQASALKDRFRILRYDTRGHGQTSAPAGPYTIQLLASDFIALLDGLGITECRFCGLSMGGMTALWLAVHHPDRVKKIVVANSAAKIGTAESWNLRIHTVASEGMANVAREVVARWFTPEFQNEKPEVVSALRRRLETTDLKGYIANCEAIRDMDQRASVAGISIPTLIISGEHDPVTPPTEGQALADAIRGAKHVKLKAAHLSNVERASEFTRALAAFLEA